MKWSIASCEADIDVVFGVRKDIRILSKRALIQFFTNARYNIVELRRTCGQGHEIMISIDGLGLPSINFTFTVGTRVTP